MASGWEPEWWYRMQLNKTIDFPTFNLYEPSQPDISERIAEFEAAHPEIAEALRLFGITMTEYMKAFQQPQTYISDHTTPL